MIRVGQGGHGTAPSVFLGTWQGKTRSCWELWLKIEPRAEFSEPWNWKWDLLKVGGCLG